APQHDSQRLLLSAAGSYPSGSGWPAGHQPADYVKLPTDHNTGHVRAVDDPAMFLTPAQVRALADATPWPYNVMVHLAAWSGPRPTGTPPSTRPCSARRCCRPTDLPRPRSCRQG